MFASVSLPASFGAALEETDRLLLDRVGVREVLAELFVEVVAADCLERGVDSGVVRAFEPLHHRPLVARVLLRAVRDVAAPLRIRRRGISSSYDESSSAS